MNISPGTSKLRYIIIVVTAAVMHGRAVDAQSGDPSFQLALRVSGAVAVTQQLRCALVVWAPQPSPSETILNHVQPPEKAASHGQRGADWTEFMYEVEPLLY